MGKCVYCGATHSIHQRHRTNTTGVPVPVKLINGLCEFCQQDAKDPQKSFETDVDRYTDMIMG